MGYWLVGGADEVAIKANQKYPGGAIRLVHWLDSTGWNRWQDAADFVETEIPNDNMTCESIGWIIHEDDDSISIAGSRTAHDQIDGVIRIPKAAIVDMWTLSIE